MNAMAGPDVTEATRVGWHIVSVKGRVDGTNAQPLTAIFLAAVAAHPRVAVDCSAVDYISSAGIAAILDGARAARSAGAQFSICAPSPRVKQLLEVTKLNEQISVLAALPV
jgi:anti-anti-sigma factor